MNEVFVNLASVLGLVGEYVRWAAGPVLEPRGDTFIGVVAVRDRDANRNWLNSFTFYAVRLNVGCDKLLLKRKLESRFDDACSCLTPYYAPDGGVWGYFGANVRDQQTAAFIPHILNVRFD